MQNEDGKENDCSIALLSMTLFNKLRKRNETKKRIENSELGIRMWEEMKQMFE